MYRIADGAIRFQTSKRVFNFSRVSSIVAYIEQVRCLPAEALYKKSLKIEKYSHGTRYESSDTDQSSAYHGGETPLTRSQLTNLTDHTTDDEFAIQVGGRIGNKEDDDEDEGDVYDELGSVERDEDDYEFNDYDVYSDDEDEDDDVDGGKMKS